MKYIHTFLKKILIAVACIVTISALWGNSVEASTLSFSPITIKVTAGQTFRLSVIATPDNSANYTVKASMKFPPDMVNVETWTFDDRWLPLRQPGYDEFNNTTGTMVRTAGFTNGFSSPVTFGTAVFVAKKTGTATIQFASDSIVLDRDNKNTYNGGNTASIVIGTPSTPVHPGVQALISTSTIPKQLLDIHLELDEKEVESMADLRPRLVFTSFGTEATPVEMSFSILTSDGKIVSTEEASTTIQTEGIYTAHLKGTDLVPGKYLLRVTTTYNKGITTEFREAIVIKKHSEPVLHVWWYVIIPFILLLYCIYKLKDRDI